MAGLRVIDGLLSHESHHFVLSNLEDERDCFILPVLNAMRNYHHDIQIMYHAELALRYLVGIFPCSNFLLNFSTYNPVRYPGTSLYQYRGRDFETSRGHS